MTYEIIQPQVIISSMMNDKEMIKQFVDMYLTQSPDDFQKLESSVAASDHANVRNHAHHIKPTMAYIGANSLHQGFQELENLARERSEFSDIQYKFEKIKQDFEKMLDELRLFAQNLV